MSFKKRGQRRVLYLLALSICAVSAFLSRRLLSEPAPPSANSVSPQGSTAPFRGYRTKYADATAIDSPWRAARNALYDKRTGEAALSATSKLHALDYPPTLQRTSFIPMDLATDVIVASLKGARSYLSGDRTAIYSEFQVQLNQILLNTSPRPLSVGEAVAVSRLGGAVKLDTGQVLIRGSQFESLPRGRSPYLMLLKYAPQADVFILVTGFELRSDSVLDLDLSSRSGQALCLGTFPGSSSQLVQAIAAQVASRQAAQN